MFNKTESFDLCTKHVSSMSRY
uniref:Uncharacterized protein n=1 Tax=Arundo donax TaxID=35708 RepID=A0A0A8YVU0_ARUDO